MTALKITFLTLFLLSTACGPLSAANVPELAKQMPHAREEVTLSYAPVLKKISPAVVNVYTLQRPKIKRSTAPLLADPFFQQYFDKMHPEEEHDQISLGSGVIINKEGYVLTNYHVVEDADMIQVALADKREFIAKPIVLDKRTDLALLKIEGKGDFPYLNVRAQENLEVGDIVLAIGNPFGMGQTVTSGIVSALARSQVGISDFHTFIQTDAAINPGNSGGALVTTDGRLVGINTAIYSKSGGSMGIGFAIPTSLALSVIESLKHGGHILRPWMGLEVAGIKIKTIEELGVDHPRGVLVKRIYPEGPADKAGIKVGDIIEAIDGKSMEDKAAFDYLVAISPLGKQTNIKIIRNGEVKSFPIEFIKPPEGSDPHPFIVEGRQPLQGAKLQILSPALALELGW
jgi:Do/DeqQ family serine protease